MSEEMCTSSCMGEDRDKALEKAKAYCEVLEKRLAEATAPPNVKAFWRGDCDCRPHLDPAIPWDRFDGMRIRVTIEGLYPCGGEPVDAKLLVDYDG